MEIEKTSKSILIVDDTVENVSLLVELLSSVGYSIRPVTSGAAAFKTIETALPDLILLDIKMPIMDGYEICGRLKADEKTKNIPIIFLSAMDNIEEKIKAFEMGGIDYITKPFQNKEVLARVNTQIELSEIRQRLNRINAELERKVLERTNKLNEMNESLQKEIIERKKAEEKIKMSLTEKQILLDELYHRTRNNMQIIISILFFKSNNTSNQELKETLNEIENKVYAMALVQKKLYELENLSNINLKEYLIDLTNHLVVSFNKLPEQVEVKFELEEMNILMDYVVSVGLILTEIVSNSLKYAFPENRKGTIFIVLHRIKDQRIELSISDDGIGVSDNFDFHNDGKMGSKIIFSLAEGQLKGKANYLNKNGISWNIQFQDNLYKKRI